MEQELIYRFGRFFLDAKKRVLVKDGELVVIRRKVLDLLVELVRARGEVLSKDDLMNRVWPDSSVGESNIFTGVSELRKILGEDRYVLNVSGTGYKFVAPVTKVLRAASEATGLSADHRRAAEPRGNNVRGTGGVKGFREATAETQRGPWAATKTMTLHGVSGMIRFATTRSSRRKPWSDL